MNWPDKCMLELTHRNLFEDDSHRARFRDLLDCYSGAPFFTKGLCKCMYLGAWDNFHFAMLLDILNEMTLERVDELDTMADNGLMLKKEALDSGDRSSARVLQLSVEFASGQPVDLSDLPELEVKDPEAAYVIKRSMLAAQCIDDLPEIPEDSVTLKKFTPVL